MIVMTNGKGKLLISPNNYDFVKRYLNKKGYSFVKLGREILLLRNKKIVGKVIWPMFVPKKTYDVEVDKE
ncbi:hypothetical protein [Desulfurobacterium sp. TC5-1]|uniref:hypothetical protein n=1 Tax=Desulfurobacterium sp. TC5-1 TaxID=1158318 RepID=UPI0003B6A6A5|nr:hypothetical protein [Desulfurobacterium sp. TC5-1]